ncbi:MAG: type II toxin-antitoxin system RelE/ParE family toxin [Polyangiaceae bacterium]|nr:type II toxin-antitoxin system RelE/ParE family toxin [Polyangiaceae bacterium]
MKRYRVDVLERAKSQLREITAWRTENRRAQADLVIDELDEATDTLAAFPEAGAEFHSRRVKGVRRWLLPRSQHWVYYGVDHELEEVRIFSIWPTARRGGPPLK